MTLLHPKILRIGALLLILTATSLSAGCYHHTPYRSASVYAKPAVVIAPSSPYVAPAVIFSPYSTYTPKHHSHRDYDHHRKDSYDRRHHSRDDYYRR